MNLRGKNVIASDWLNKELKKTRSSILRAEAKPNVCQDELSNLKEKEAMFVYLIGLVERENRVEKRLSDVERLLKEDAETDRQQLMIMANYQYKNRIKQLEKIVYGIEE